MKTIMYARCALRAATLWLTGSPEDSAGPDPCASRIIALTASITDDHQGESDGSIRASASGSSGFMFRLNGGSYQPSSTFGSRAAGTYTITVKDKDDCTISQNFTVDELSPATVSYSARIKPIIETVCWNCHKQEGQTGFPHATLTTKEKVKDKR